MTETHATASVATIQAPRVVAVVPSAPGSKLTLLDARTLRPAPGWSRTVGRHVPAALSPSGSHVALVPVSGARMVLDSSTGRVVKRDESPGDGRIYWLGGDGAQGGLTLLFVSEALTVATSVGPTLYADTTAGTRYSVDLRSGKTTGPFPIGARIVTPSYVVIP